MDMVLIGGLWTRPEIWDQTIAALAERGHRAVAVALPGQGDGVSSATLEDQLAAALRAVDATTSPLVVGHSAACSIAWMVADARPDIAGVVFVGGMPVEDGGTYAAFFPVVDGLMAFPGWDAFAGPDSDDLTEEHKSALALEQTPVPQGVAEAVVHLASDARYRVPIAMVCTEYSAADARAWVEGGDIPEVAAAERVSYIDIDTGHWPQASAPAVLADALVDSIPSP